MLIFVLSHTSEKYSGVFPMKYRENTPIDFTCSFGRYT